MRSECKHWLGPVRTSMLIRSSRWVDGVEKKKCDSFPMMLLQLTFDMQQDHNILKKMSFLSILLLSKVFPCLRIERLSSIYVL